MTSPQSPLKHIAVIMDGNRRWATKQGLPSLKGHTTGAETFQTVVELCGKRGIPYLTFYALSTENLKGRSELELKHLFSLIDSIEKYIPDLEKNEIQFRVIGDMEALPAKTKKILTGLIEKTRNYSKMTLTLAINYGGRDEITRAVKKIVAAKIKPEQISEELLTNYLDTTDIPEVDLMIRTGGDQRLSNYLPWQTTYAELYFTPVYWPDFDEPALQKAIDWFQEQRRNKGK